MKDVRAYLESQNRRQQIRQTVREFTRAAFREQILERGGRGPHFNHEIRELAALVPALIEFATVMENAVCAATPLADDGDGDGTGTGGANAPV